VIILSCKPELDICDAWRLVVEATGSPGRRRSIGFVSSALVEVGIEVYIAYDGRPILLLLLLLLIYPLKLS
jgi:hypothetical protein